MAVQVEEDTGLEADMESEVELETMVQVMDEADTLAGMEAEAASQDNEVPDSLQADDAIDPVGAIETEIETDEAVVQTDEGSVSADEVDTETQDETVGEL